MRVCVFVWERERGNLQFSAKTEQDNLPHNKKAMAIYVPWLQSVFSILKYNFNITSEISSHDRSLEITTSTSGTVWNASKGKYPWDLEVVSKLKWRISWDERDTIDSISLLAIDNWSRVCESYCACGVDHSIMVRTLRIRSWPTCCEIPSGIIHDIK